MSYPQDQAAGQENLEGEEEAQDVNHLVTSDEMYMSESYGYNFSVNTEAMEHFDYVEDVEPIDE